MKFPIIVTFQVLLIDGAFARPITNMNFSEDGRRFQLMIRRNTRVFLIKDMRPLHVPLPSFEEADHYNSIQDMLRLPTKEDKVPVGKYELMHYQTKC